MRLEEAEDHATVATLHNKHRVSPELQIASKLSPQKRRQPGCRGPSSSRLEPLRLNAGYVGDGVNVSRSISLHAGVAGTAGR